MKHISYIFCALAVTATAVISCSRNPEWSIKGNIEGADEGAVLLEASNPGGYWYAVDTLDIDKNGKFGSTQSALMFPDIYRLNYNGRHIYFPVDSIDNLTVTTKANAFDTDYTLSGSEKAEIMMDFDHKINAFLSGHKAEDLDTAVNFKREFSKVILNDPSSIVAYYIVNKQVKSRPLFRVDNRQELGVYGAVANAYSEMRPNDPRTGFMRAIWLTFKPKPAVPTDTIVAQELPIIDISLMDNNGKTQTLSQVAGSNKVVVLNFTNYKSDYSQALNIKLRELYDAYHNAGLEIYQIGFDNSEFDWRVAAGNQPWITVYNGTTDQHLRNYNIGSLPAMYIINNGEIVERVSSIDGLKSSVSRYISAR